MHTNATLHVHPAAANPFQVFEARRLARASGCAFVPTKPKLHSLPRSTPHSPTGGGHAA